MKYAASYSRVSTSDQKDGFSLTDQTAKNVQLAVDKGYIIPDEFCFQEQASGLAHERPLLSRVRRLAREGKVEAVFVFVEDRLSRDDLHLELFIREFGDYGVEVWFTRYNEKAEITAGTSIAQGIRRLVASIELEKIRERTVAGKRSKVTGEGRPGGPLPAGGGGVPYGYCWDGAGPRKKTLKIVPELAEVIQYIFTLYTVEGLIVYP